MEKDEIQDHLDAIDRIECYRVDETIKKTALGSTERVYFMGENGSKLGPYIRKRFSLESGLGNTYELVFRAQQSGKRLAHLSHIVDFNMTESCFEVIMDYVEGKTLFELIEEKGPSIEFAKEVFPALCDAVSELHEAFDPPIIHRDLTPTNIIVSEGNVTLIDLGISRVYKPGSIHDTNFFGTKGYAAPEQRGEGQTDVRSDVYAMGMLLRDCFDKDIYKARLRSSGKEQQAEGFDRDKNDPWPRYVYDRVRKVSRRAANDDPDLRYESAARLKEAFLEAIELHESEDDLNANLESDASTELPAPDPENRIDIHSPSEELSLLNAELHEAKNTPPLDMAVEAESDAPSIDQEPKKELKTSTIDQEVEPELEAPSSDQLVKIEANTQLFNVGASMPRKSSRFSVPTTLGVVWDVALALFWVLIVMASIALVFDPETNYVIYPEWFRVVLVFGIATIPFTIVCFYLLDLRLLREKFPGLKLLSRRKTWFFVPAVIIVLWLATYTIAYFNGFTTS